MTTLAPTLYNRAFPKDNQLGQDIKLILAGVFLVAIFAQIKIPLPFTPVPLTGQTFAVLLVGAVLGSKRGIVSQTLYTLLGGLGLPFFAGGQSGFAYLTGPTFGYVLGFIVATYFIGYLSEHGLERNIRTSFIPFLVGTVIIYLFGAGWLAIQFGAQKALTLGVLPFLLGDGIKFVLASIALPVAWKLAQ